MTNPADLDDSRLARNIELAESGIYIAERVIAEADPSDECSMWHARKARLSLAGHTRRLNELRAEQERRKAPLLWRAPGSSGKLLDRTESEG